MSIRPETWRDFATSSSRKPRDNSSSVCPLVAIVEAKNDDLRNGLGPCIAAMFAASLFNQQAGNPIPVVHGVVTTGGAWMFLRLAGSTVTLDSRNMTSTTRARSWASWGRSSPKASGPDRRAGRHLTRALIVLELRVLGALDPLEQGGLGRRDDGPGPLQAAEGELAVDGEPRADRVGRDLDRVAQPQQLQGRLGDADVGLDPGQGDVADAPGLPGASTIPGAPREWKVVLAGRSGISSASSGDGRAEPPGILLGRQDRDAQEPRRPDQPDGVGEEPVAAVDGREELLLDVDDQQGAALGRSVDRARHRSASGSRPEDRAIIDRRNEPPARCYESTPGASSRALAWSVGADRVMISVPRRPEPGRSRGRPGPSPASDAATPGREPPLVAEKPRLLVIERDTPEAASARERLAEGFEVVRARTMARAMVLLREQEFAGVYVDSAQLSAVRWAGVLIQADEILDAIADGVAVVDPDLRVIWTNPEFLLLADPAVETDRHRTSTGRWARPRSSARSPARSPRRWRPRARPARRSGSTPTATSGSPPRRSSTARGGSPT